MISKKCHAEPNRHAELVSASIKKIPKQVRNDSPFQVRNDSSFQVRNGTLFSFLIIILLLGTIFFVPSINVLAISSRKNPEQRFYSRAGYKNNFVISYTHSVNKGRVHDIYTKTEDNQLKLDKTIFVSYGAGIPEPEETPGAEFKVLDNGYEISNLNRIVPKLTMAVGIIANHVITFYYDKEALDYPLTDFFAPQTSLILEIKRVNLVEYIKYRI